MNNQPNVTENNSANVERQSDETRLAGELEKMLLDIKYSTIDGLSNLNHYDIRQAKKQILAWHETKKQKYANECISRIEEYYYDNHDSYDHMDESFSEAVKLERELNKSNQWKLN